MITLITTLIFISLSSVALADNLVSITQIGDDLTVNISQEGNNNTITKNIWTVPADWEGDDNTFDLRQKNTTNNNQSNYMGFHIDGDNNTVKVGQGYADQGSLETAHVQEWNTDNWEGGGNTAMIDIHGHNNILNIGQRNGSQGSYSGHDVTAYIYGDDNVARAVQVHDGAKDLTLTLIGDDHRIYTEQRSTGAHNMTVSLTNGGGAYSAFLKQNSTTTQNYSLTGTCNNSGGCSLSVTQQ
tara:strand:+ start:182 stop:904 length:723 start_codon:yes stop_codon:yes gene_type:complete